MNTYLRYVGGGALLLIVIGILLPSRAHIEREIVIDAHAATVFALLNDFRQINRWSRWMEADPNVRLDLSGPLRGVGATMSWDGQIIGQGRQTIVASVPFEKISSTLGAGDQQSATSTYTLTESPTGTLVTWSYEREFGFNLAGRYFSLMLDGIVGPEHERDLQSLKELAENMPKADFSELELEQIVVEARNIAYIRTTSIPAAAAISKAMGKAYFEVLGFIDDQNLREAGAPISITRTFSGSELVFDSGIPVRGVNDNTPRTALKVKIGATYAGPVVRVKHIGPYRDLGRTHDKIAAYLAALGIERNGDAWESYISDPARTNEDSLLTYVYYPILLPSY